LECLATRFEEINTIIISGKSKTLYHYDSISQQFTTILLENPKRSTL